MSDARIDSIIELLEHILVRPGYYTDYWRCVGFLQGIEWMACKSGVVSFDTFDKIYKEASARFGWESAASSPAWLIAELDWDERKKIQEVAKIELAVWKEIATL